MAKALQTFVVFILSSLICTNVAYVGQSGVGISRPLLGEIVPLLNYDYKANVFFQAMFLRACVDPQARIILEVLESDRTNPNLETRQQREDRELFYMQQSIEQGYLLVNIQKNTPAVVQNF